MTSGGMSKAEAWNIQLQHKIDRLEKERDELRSERKIMIASVDPDWRDHETARGKLSLMHSRAEMAEAERDKLREALELAEAKCCEGYVGRSTRGEQDVTVCKICNHAETDMTGHADDCPFAALSTDAGKELLERVPSFAAVKANPCIIAIQAWFDCDEVSDEKMERLLNEAKEWLAAHEGESDGN